MKSVIIYHTVPIQDFDQNGDKVTIFYHHFKADDIYFHNDNRIVLKNDVGDNINIRLASTDFIFLGDEDDVKPGTVIVGK